MNGLVPPFSLKAATVFAVIWSYISWATPVAAILGALITRRYSFIFMVCLFGKNLIVILYPGVAAVVPNIAIKPLLEEPRPAGNCLESTLSSVTY